ncbi:DUF2029 domain-containing protein [Leptospira selangorensis]|uniref:DUF2029 domain-containing protein n=1 Tax=Leptospira selangorensis TaxID=2484982 RepID=A0A5F2C5Z6_9LEPT|nr:DUF2029 domain-containing protein [Leptospira selangorensis]TGM13539.1 DUF2029 domain-containing protein [Leptospira selangorensis]TGM22120.1 DUF2029 domain-containing protein [Leptospira selangorensis]
MKKSRAQKEIDSDSWIDSINIGIDLCEKVAKRHQEKAEVFLKATFGAAIAIGMLLFMTALVSFTQQVGPSFDKIADLLRTSNPDSVKHYFTLFKPLNTEYIIVPLCLLLVTLVGIILALYRMHVTEMNKYEYLRIGLIRTRIALVYSTKQELPIAFLMLNAFDYEKKGYSNRAQFESAIPGMISSDIFASLMNNAAPFLSKVNRKSK